MCTYVLSRCLNYKGSDAGHKKKVKTATKPTKPITTAVSAKPENIQSPLHYLITPSQSAGIRGSSCAQDFWCMIVQDVMYDFQWEFKAEMVGLHLNLVRMDRGWLKEEAERAHE